MSRNIITPSKVVLGKKIIQGLLLTMLLLQYGMVFAQANDYVPLAPLPGTTGNCVQANGCSTNLSTYLPGLFKLLIGVGAVAAFVVITLYGFEYMLTDSLNTKMNAKGMLENALWGLGLIIFAYVILNTINPKLLSGTLNITPPTAVLSPSGGLIVGGTCPTCQNLQSLGLPNGSRVNPTTIGVDPNFGSKLKSLDSTLTASNITWNITEGYPPSSAHQDSCHANGTCVDASLGQNPSSSSLNTFYATAQSKNLNASLEVQNQAQKEALIRSGVTVPITINSSATGIHFHIK